MIVYVSVSISLPRGSGGNWHTSYAAVPMLYTTAGRGLILDGGNSTSTFGFNFSNPDAIDIELWVTPDSNSLDVSAYLVQAPQPAAYIQEATLHTGRMSPLPAWTQTGAIVGFEGGTEAVLNITSLLAQHGVPVAAMWLQVRLLCSCCFATLCYAKWMSCWAL